jgi:hypothetical protein
MGKLFFFSKSWDTLVNAIAQCRPYSSSQELKETSLPIRLELSRIVVKNLVVPALAVHFARSDGC